MVDMCEFTMQVSGKLEDIAQFYAALIQSGDTYIGRGALADINYITSETAIINGCCKWNVQSALFDDALSMKKQKEEHSREWSDIDSVREILTLYEACEKYHVSKEVSAKAYNSLTPEVFKYPSKA